LDVCDIKHPSYLGTKRREILFIVALVAADAFRTIFGVVLEAESTLMSRSAAKISIASVSADAVLPSMFHVRW
jgi:hypothetical protein